jgi:hypothetical protein
MRWHCPWGPNHATNGFLPPHGRSSIKGRCYDSRGSYHSRPLVSSEGKLPLGSRETVQSTQRQPRRRSRGTWWPGNQRKHGGASGAGTKPSPIARRKQARCHLPPRLPNSLPFMGEWPQKETPFPFMSTRPTFRMTSPVTESSRAVVRELQNRRAAGTTGLQAEHIKVWLTDVCVCVCVCVCLILRLRR